MSDTLAAVPTRREDVHTPTMIGEALFQPSHLQACRSLAGTGRTPTGPVWRAGSLAGKITHSTQRGAFYRKLASIVAVQ